MQEVNQLTLHPDIQLKKLTVSHFKSPHQTVLQLSLSLSDCFSLMAMNPISTVNFHLNAGCTLSLRKLEIRREREFKWKRSACLGHFEYKYIWRYRSASFSKMRGRYDRARYSNNFNHKKVIYTDIGTSFPGCEFLFFKF